MRTRLNRGPLLLGVLIGLWGVAPATATGEPPEAALIRNDRVRPVNYWTADWNGVSDGSCQAVISDGIPSYHPLIETRRGNTRPTIVLRKRQQPAEITFRSYPRLVDGLAAGPAQTDRPPLEPKLRNGSVIAWTAQPRLRVAERLYVHFEVSWPDLSGCGIAQFDTATWSFGVRRR